MTDLQEKIFLVEPNDKEKYNAKISWADDEIEARSSAQATYNPALELPPQRNIGYSPPRIDPVYTDKSLSSCKQIFPEKQSRNNSGGLDVVYNGKLYYLEKHDSEDV